MDIYGEIILDHFKNPRQAGLLKNSDLQAEDFNPLCGDKVKVSLKVDPAGKISKFGFEGDGCAISVASESLLGEKIIGLNLNEVTGMENEEVLKMLGIPISPGRVKCAVLGFSCIKKAAKVHLAENHSPSGKNTKKQ
jgi:nitrogen fixation NifU-like protein